MKRTAPHLEGLTDERTFIPGGIRLKCESINLEERTIPARAVRQGTGVFVHSGQRQQSTVTFTAVDIPGAALRTILGLDRVPPDQLPPLTLHAGLSHYLTLSRYTIRQRTVDQDRHGAIRLTMVVDSNHVQVVRNKG